MSGRASSSPVLVDEARKHLPLRPHHNKPILKYSPDDNHISGSRGGQYGTARHIASETQATVGNEHTNGTAQNQAVPSGKPVPNGSGPGTFYANYMYLTGPGTPSGNGLNATSVGLTPGHILATSITTSTKVNKNPYARPISANDVEPHPNMLVKSSSSTSVITSSNNHSNSHNHANMVIHSNSHNHANAYNHTNQASSQNGSNTSPVQTNAFLRPQSSTKRVTSPTTTSPSPESVPPGILKHTSSMPSRPCQKPGFSSKALPATPLVDSSQADERGLHGNLTNGLPPKPPAARKPSVSRPNSGLPKKVSITLPHETQPSSVPKSPSGVSHLPKAKDQGRGSAVQSPGSDSNSSRASPVRQGTPTSIAEGTLKVRNLNYTPTKPYSEVSEPSPETVPENNTRGDEGAPKSQVASSSSGKNNVQSSRQRLANGAVKPTRDSSGSLTRMSMHGSPVMFKHRQSESVTEMLKDGSLKKMPVTNTLTGTVYYRKGSKCEAVLPDRPSADGAPGKTDRVHDGGQNLGPSLDDDDDDEENDDVDEDDKSQGPKSSERLPGDGQDFDSRCDDDDDDDDDDDGVDDDEDDDDVMDGFDDEDDDSDGNSDGYSIHTGTSSSSSSRRSSASTGLQRARSATHRLGQLSLVDRPRPSTARPISSTSSTSIPDTALQPALTPSLFPNIPPTVNFVTEQYKIEQLPWELRKLLKWKMSPITPNVIKHCIARSGFRATRKNYDWLGYWGKHMKSPGFKTIREYQKFNHFPGSFQIGRKDRLWRNLSRMQVMYGKREFSFFPQTFCLPCDLKQLKRVWEDGGSKQKWIIKPPASARGIGIKVINKWNQIPKKRPVIVQHYLGRPYLINGSKFDLRIYVYVTSYDPLRIYVYDDGLTRFASTKYSYSMKNLSNKYMHLTNYSINKKNTDYESNTDETVCQGHKWGLKALWGYFKRQGISYTHVWESIKDLIVKTILCSEACVSSLVKGNVRRRYNVHELFGFDVMLDENLKPWIIEVNISPSLHSNSQLDMNIKGGMMKDLLNLCGFMLPDKSEVTPTLAPNMDNSRHQSMHGLCLDRRLWPNSLSPDERAKHAYYCQRHNDEFAQQTILDTLTPDDLRILAEAIDEESRRGNFERAFPSPSSHKYLRFFEQPRYYSLLLNQWTQRYQRMESRGISLIESYCERGIHLENPTDSSKHQWAPPNALSLRDPRVASAPATPKSGAGFPSLRRPKKTSTPSTNTNSNASSTPSGPSRPPTTQSLGASPS